MRFPGSLFAFTFFLLSRSTPINHDAGTSTDSCKCGDRTQQYDFVIIGGGSSRTYTAFQLQKAGKNIALIKRNERLGGHFNTYIDPVTNETIDYSIINYINTTTAHDYFSYLDIPIKSFLGFTRHLKTNDVTALWADFAAATAIPTRIGSQLHSQNETINLASYTAFEMHHEYAAWTGSMGYTYLPKPVPEELFLPFG